MDLNLHSISEVGAFVKKEIERLQLHPGPPSTPLMAYELKILHKVLQNLGCDMTDTKNTQKALAQAQVKAEVLEENVKVLNKRIEDFERKNNQLAAKLQQSEEQILRKDKFLASLNKKCESFDRLGGKIGFEEKDSELKANKQALKQLREKYKKVDGKVSEAQRSVQIYKSLNSQQQNTIAQLKIKIEQLENQLEQQLQPLFKKTTLKVKKQNPPQAAQPQKKSDSVQTMSLKQKIRQLTQSLQTSRKQHENARASWQKKQNHYSRLLEKYFLQQSPI